MSNPDEHTVHDAAWTPETIRRFHRIQHVSSWTAATLRDVMAEAGFECRYCQATLLAKRG